MVAIKMFAKVGVNFIPITCSAYFTAKIFFENYLHVVPLELFSAFIHFESVGGVMFKGFLLCNVLDMKVFRWGPSILIRLVCWTLCFLHPDN